MRKIITVISVVLLLCAAASLLVHIFSREPAFQGKPISEWLVKANRPDDWIQFTNAIHEIGVPAVPYIVRKLHHDHSGFDKRYRNAWPKLPTFIRKILKEPEEPFAEVTAVNAFCDIGPSVIPSLVTLLKHSDPLVRSSAAWALESLRRTGETNTVKVAELMEALNDPDAGVRLASARALGEFGPDAAVAVVPLIRRLKDDDKGADPARTVFVRAAAARALGRIGPHAKAAIPSLRALTNDSHFYTQLEADIALWRIQRDTNAAVAMLLADLPSVGEHSKWEVFQVFEEMGPAARDAVPALKADLKSSNSEVRQRAAEALWKIDPSEAVDIVPALVEPMDDPRATTANLFSITLGSKLLGQMGASAKPAIPSLQKLLTNSYPDARDAAREALKRIGTN